MRVLFSQASQRLKPPGRERVDREESVESVESVKSVESVGS